MQRVRYKEEDECAFRKEEKKSKRKRRWTRWKEQWTTSETLFYLMIRRRSDTEKIYMREIARKMQEIQRVSRARETGRWKSTKIIIIIIIIKDWNPHREGASEDEQITKEGGREKWREMAGHERDDEREEKAASGVTVRRIMFIGKQDKDTERCRRQQNAIGMVMRTALILWQW